MDGCIPRTSRRVQWTAAVVFLSIALAPAAALADDNTAGSMAKGIGIGTASALSSLIYGPCKIAYAATGVIVGGLGWIFSGGDSEVAKTVMTPAVYGDYVVSPSVLMGEDTLEFLGRAPGKEALDVNAAPPDDW